MVHIAETTLLTKSHKNEHKYRPYCRRSTFHQIPYIQVVWMRHDIEHEENLQRQPSLNFLCQNTPKQLLLWIRSNASSTVNRNNTSWNDSKAPKTGGTKNVLWTYTRHAIIVYLNNLLCPLLISYYSEAILINYMPTLNQRSC